MPRINKEYHKEAKNKIILAALEVAAQDGWASVTLDSIAQKVGVTKGAFYSYFPNGNALMQDTVIEMIRTIRNQMMDEISDIDECEQSLEIIADTIFFKMKSILPAFIQAMASNLVKENEFKTKLSALLEENINYIIAFLSQYQQKGQIPEEVDLRSAIFAIYGMTMGLGLMTHILGKDPKIMRDIWLESARKNLKL